MSKHEIQIENWSELSEWVNDFLQIYFDFNKHQF